MNSITNIINLVGWSAVLLSVTFKLISNPYTYDKTDITPYVTLLQIVQSLMVFDIVLILIGKSKGSLLGSIAQALGRLVVALYFI